MKMGKRSKSGDRPPSVPIPQHQQQEDDFDKKQNEEGDLKIDFNYSVSLICTCINTGSNPIILCISYSCMLIIFNYKEEVTTFTILNEKDFGIETRTNTSQMIRTYG